MTISRVQVCSSSRWRVLLKLTADQVQAFEWIAGSCPVKLLKTDLGLSWVVQEPVSWGSQWGGGGGSLCGLTVTNKAF